MQLELSLHAPAPAEQADVRRFAEWLYAAGDKWLPARDICAALELTARQVRHLAASSDGLIVSSPGSPGYKHVRHCDPEEIKAITSGLEHQAKLMATRASAIRRAHRLASI